MNRRSLLTLLGAGAGNAAFAPMVATAIDVEHLETRRFSRAEFQRNWMTRNEVRAMEGLPLLARPCVSLD